jgi:hypothetical protein
VPKEVVAFRRNHWPLCDSATDQVESIFLPISMPMAATVANVA